MGIFKSRFWHSFVAAALPALILACAAGDEQSPIGRNDAFQPPPLAIYVAVDEPSDDTQGVDAPQPSHEGGSVRIGLCGALPAIGSEVTGYASYVYVLTGAISDVKTPGYAATIARYRHLFRAVGQATGPVPAASATAADHMFYLPGKGFATSEATDRDTMGDRPLASQWIAHVSALVGNQSPAARKMRTRPGPFLIAAAQPISRMKGDGEILFFADLSDVPQGAMTDIVHAFHMKMERLQEGGRVRFAYLRLRLLNLIPNADDNLMMIRVGQAGKGAAD